MTRALFCRRWMSTASLLLAAAFTAPAQAVVPVIPFSAFSDLVVFGDSLSDPGNNAAFLFGSPYFLRLLLYLLHHNMILQLPHNLNRLLNHKVFLNLLLNLYSTMKDFLLFYNSTHNLLLEHPLHPM